MNVRKKSKFTSFFLIKINSVYELISQVILQVGKK